MIMSKNRTIVNTIRAQTKSLEGLNLTSVHSPLESWRLATSESFMLILLPDARLGWQLDLPSTTWKRVMPPAAHPTAMKDLLLSMWQHRDGF